MTRQGIRLTRLSALLLVLGASLALGLHWRATSAAREIAPEEQEVIKNVIDRSYAVFASGLVDLDSSKFDSVYVNAPGFQLDEGRASFVQQVRERYVAKDELPNEDGWLSFRVAQVIDRRYSITAYQQAEAAAKAQGRAMTKDEFLSTAGVTGQVAAPNVIQRPMSVDVIELKLDDNRAEVVYDDGAVTARAFLIKTDDGWRIAGVDALDVHP